MLTDKTKEFLSIQMCIDLQAIDNSFKSLLTASQQQEAYRYLNTIVSYLNNLTDFDSLRNEFLSIANSARDDNELNYHMVLDSIRHLFDVFTSYSRVGNYKKPWNSNTKHQKIINIWRHQESEVWYPNIVINEKLFPNQISSLAEIVTIYRGCDEGESTRGFGQSWSLNEEEAYRFAFNHYASQPWFDLNRRAVYQASISREDIYYYVKGGEEEVIVNPSLLLNIQKIS